MKCKPKAKTDDPNTVRKEKTKTPTRKKQKKCTNLKRHADKESGQRHSASKS